MTARASRVWLLDRWSAAAKRSTSSRLTFDGLDTANEGLPSVNVPESCRGDDRHRVRDFERQGVLDEDTVAGRHADADAM